MRSYLFASFAGTRLTEHGQGRRATKSASVTGAGPSVAACLSVVQAKGNRHTTTWYITKQGDNLG
jgi:bifunctional ADP-heptose synthase (sugar kinase/adenylyltransferase)